MSIDEKNLQDFLIIISEILTHMEQMKTPESAMKVAKEMGMKIFTLEIKPSKELYEREKKNNQKLWDSLYFHHKLNIRDKGHKALSNIIGRILNNQKYSLKNRVSHSSLQTSIIDNFLLATIIQGKEMTISLAMKIIDKSIKNVLNNIETTNYFFPCMIAYQDNEDEFIIGPIKFMTMNRFWSQNQKTIDKSLKISQEEILKYFNKFPWIAEVIIDHLEDERAEELSKQAVQYALNIFKIYTPHYYNKKLRIAGDTDYEPTCTLKIRNGEPLTTISSSTLGWFLHDKKFSEEAGPRFTDISRLTGQLITSFLSGHNIPLIYQRLLNAIWWFGDAVDEQSSSAQLIKYINVIEAIINTDDRDKSTTDQFRKRTIDILSGCLDTMFDNNSQLTKHLNNIYGVRSDLVHGKKPPTDVNIYEEISFAHDVASHVIHNAFYWSIFLAEKNVNMSLKSISREFDNSMAEFNKRWVQKKEGPNPAPG
ncbi:MAG: hypothetical protein COB49_05015 [Alphaproteobacteria bacterium]|nr:MAG: hypothetical protein COB49_05015 [Alphaproteobacteria bacterium]